MTEEPRRFSDEIIIDLKNKIDQIYEMLMGDPGTPGIVLRLDRLEQSEIYRQKKSERAWQGRLAVYTILAGLILERIWSHVHG